MTGATMPAQSSSQSFFTRSAGTAAAASSGGDEGVPSGTIVGISREGLDVACGGGSILRLRRVQPESRGPVSGFDFANGAKLKPGSLLGGWKGADPASRPSGPQD